MNKRRVHHVEKSVGRVTSSEASAIGVGEESPMSGKTGFRGDVIAHNNMAYQDLNFFFFEQ
jgi:hypothetical protein